MQFPINLNLTGRPVLLVGGGRIALRKAQQLLACGARLSVLAPSILPEFADLPVARIERSYEAGDIDGFRLIVSATGDPVVDQAIFDEAEARGIWMNSADDPERCTFTLPAVIRRGDVMVTASTGGRSPALSTWLRERLGEVITPEFESVVDELSEERDRIHATGASTEDTDWRPVIEAVLADHHIVGFAVRTPTGVR